ncbi:hypothetical protein AB0M44_06060, partial [Streptosporangium subroseum]|uniref:hypothetical protein n=1 Tax=Streptosporangium subroseum TaxID=106412 RepID=UPI00343D5E43
HDHERAPRERHEARNAQELVQGRPDRRAAVGTTRPRSSPAVGDRWAPTAPALTGYRLPSGR